MITRYTPPFRSEIPPQWRGACAAVAGGGPNRATAIVVARLVFTISGQSRAFTALRLIDLVTAVHSRMNELSTLEFALQQLARLEEELAPDGAVPGPLMLALSCRTRIGTVRRGGTLLRGSVRLSIQDSNRFKNSLAVGPRGDSDLFEIHGGQRRQNFGIDRIGIENRNILFKAKALEPSCNVHKGGPFRPLPYRITHCLVMASISLFGDRDSAS